MALELMSILVNYVSADIVLDRLLPYMVRVTSANTADFLPTEFSVKMELRIDSPCLWPCNS